MKAYKVLKQIEGELYSISTKGQNLIHYIPGKTIRAPKKTGIFIFPHLDDAIKFADVNRCDGMTKIWFCEVDSASLLHKRLNTVDLLEDQKMMNLFWNAVRSDKLYSPRFDVLNSYLCWSPAGTYSCKKIKLLNEIDIETVRKEQQKN